MRWQPQPEVGEHGYDAGARQLIDFFASAPRPYLDNADLDSQGRRIIKMALDGANLLTLEAALQPGTAAL